MKRPNVPTSKRPAYVRRGFNLVELLIALGITAALLTATLVALNASFRAYQATTEVSSTHTIARLTMIANASDSRPPAPSPCRAR